MTSYSDAQAEAVAQIRLGGLNPDLIRVRGIDRWGYDEFVVGPDGKRVIGVDGLAETVRKRWPDAFRWPATAKLRPILRFARVWGDR